MTHEGKNRYLVSLTVTSVLFATLSLYLFFRRGYYTLYIVNKAAGGTALVSLGVVLLLGTLARLYKRFDPWIVYRKELGILALAWALVHGLISLFFLPDHFPFFSYLSHPTLPFVFGLTSLLLLALLFFISLDTFMNRMNKQVWWKFQNYGGRIAGLLALAHVLIMKYPGWIMWYTKGGAEELARPFMPPASILAGSFGIYVLFVRILEPALKRTAVLLLTILLVFFWTGSLLWGRQKTPTALPLHWTVCKTLPNAKILELYPPICIAPDGRRATWEPPK